jgi:hypothetical protein
MLAALSTVGLLASACKGQSASLREQADAYWKARVKGEVERAYKFEASGTVDKNTYTAKILNSPIVFKEYAIDSIKEDGDQAVVQLRMEYLLPGLSRPASSTMLDKWVRVRGRWYHQFPLGDSGTGPTERR